MHKEVKYGFALILAAWLLQAVMIALDHYGYSEYSRIIMLFMVVPIVFLGTYFAAKHVSRTNKDFFDKVLRRKPQQTDETKGS